jgi:hypothetical protein
MIKMCKPPISDAAPNPALQEWSYEKALLLGTAYAREWNYHRVMSDECLRAKHLGQCKNPKCWCVCHEQEIK